VGTPFYLNSLFFTQTNCDYNNDGGTLLCHHSFGSCVAHTAHDARLPRPASHLGQHQRSLVLSQFSVSKSVYGPGYFQCVAVSNTSDASGAYNTFVFKYGTFPDYPKMGLWPDAYYIAYNMFKGKPLVSLFSRVQKNLSSCRLN